MKRILQEPLLHFLVSGALLFVVFHFTGKRQADPKTQVVITPGQTADLSAGFAHTWQRFNFTVFDCRFEPVEESQSCRLESTWQHTAEM